MTTPRLTSPASIETRQTAASSDGCFDGEKIAKSESLSALFSYFKNWSQQDPSLKFKGESVIKIDEEAAA
jgi:hypothetical protein